MVHRAGRLHVVELLDVVSAHERTPGPAVVVDVPRAPRRGRRTMVAAAGALLAVVACLMLADGRQGPDPVARIAKLPGGLVSMAKQPTETWRVPTSSGNVAVLDGTLVVEDHLTGRDPATGEVRWRTPAWSGVTNCEPVPFPDTSSVDVLVCVSGPVARAVRDPAPAPYDVRVVGPGGAILAHRTVTDALVAPLPNGGVVHGRLEPNAANLTAEDAATGKVRWQRQVPRSWDEALWGYDEDGRPYSPPFSAKTRGGVTRVEGDGVDVMVDDAGRDVGSVDVPARSLAVADGASGRTSGSDTHIKDVAEKTARDRRGQLLVPAVTDGTAEQVLVLAGTEHTTGIDAVTGLTLWELPRTFESALGRIGNVLLLDDYLGVTAVDISTGRILWARGGLPRGAGVSTDGTRVVLAPLGAVGISQGLVAVEITDGSIAWTYGSERPIYGAFAIDGRLVAFEADANGTVLVGVG